MALLTIKETSDVLGMSLKSVEDLMNSDKNGTKFKSKIIGKKRYVEIKPTALNYYRTTNNVEYEDLLKENILGQKDVKLKDALNRKYTLPFLFKGNKNEKNKLLKVLNSNSLTLQEGGRVLNLCDNINKVKSMNRVIKILKKTEDKIKTIAVGDNYNDLDMLKSCDIPCLVFNDQFIQDQINIDNLIFSNKPSPEGWADVIKTALLKLDY